MYIYIEIKRNFSYQQRIVIFSKKQTLKNEFDLNYKYIINIMLMFQLFPKIS